ncbi:DNA polymerase IV [Neobacillus sedimentimangrovi]|uniref:DNA polymerase IV n=1 Tax=Neobacillus sedimentimangrovi TaxID=2699460 RepID=A0ABS8QK41_9BACI|nr:DNA polymerase IV [Neobacillus sedimentimangrovi]MCD4839601.1 DNA polymerase IV [Neobacillus sedimentimangrovi]
MKKMYPKNGRVILHVDMNSFYASVEMAYDPSLKGKPLAIAGSVEERRGIIVTCSYEARKFGVKTTMPLWQAKKLCPQLIVKPPNFERYRAASKGIFDILRHYTELVEPVSIDEGYMDITESFEFGTPIEIAESIQKRILEQLDLPCSIGIAPNKFLAKTASDMKKPLGITILRKRDIPNILWPLNTSEMHGVGKKTAEKLKTIGIQTIGDLAKANDIQLKTLLGINGVRLKERANGIDHRPVDPESIEYFKSIGNSTTLPHDTTNQQEIFHVLDSLATTVSVRLKRKNVLSTTLGVTIRYKDRKTITRSTKTGNPINQKEEISEQAKQLFMKHWNGNPVRLLGITGFDLVEQEHAYKQLNLFSYEKEAKKEPLLKTLSSLRDKYGKKIIKSAGSHMVDPTHRIGTNTSFNKDFLQAFSKKEDEND